MCYSSLFQTNDVTKSDRYLHTPSSFARQNLLYVQEVGRLTSINQHRCIREGLDSFLLMVVLKGQGVLTIKDKEYRMQEGNIAFVDCREHYEHISDNLDAWTLCWVHFYGGSARNYYELFQKHSKNKNVFAVEDTSKWDETIGLLMNKQQDKGIVAEIQSGELLLKLLGDTIGHVADTDVLRDEENRKLVQDIRAYLHENYANIDVLQGVSKQYGSTYEELNSLFRVYFNITMEEYVSNRRFLVAKELLRFSIKSLAEVAEESGIRDVITMQQMFYDRENMTADEYRSKWAQWIR